MNLAHAPGPEAGKEPVATYAAALCVVHHALSWCLLAAALAPSVAMAQADEPRILVVRGADPARSVPVAERVRARWTARGADVRLPSPPEAEPDEAAPIEEARRAYHDLRPDAAREILEAWLVRADRTGGAGLDRPTLLDGLVWLALARAALGDPEGADRAFDRALAIDPSLVLDEATFAPHVRERLDARRAAIDHEQSTLTVEATLGGAPEGADDVARAPIEVRVDGEIAGAPPLELSLARGEHLVRATSPAARPNGRAVTLGEEGAVLQLDLQYDAERVLAAARPVGGDPEIELVAAARATGAALALLDAERTPLGWRLGLRDGATGTHASAGPGASLERTVESLLDGLEPSVVETPTVGEDPWPWIGLGAGAAVVAALAIGLAVGLSSNPDGFTAVGTKGP